MFFVLFYHRFLPLSPTPRFLQQSIHVIILFRSCCNLPEFFLAPNPNSSISDWFGREREKMGNKNIPPGPKWNVAVCSFCLLGIPRDSLCFSHKNWGYWFCKLLHPAGGSGGLLFLVFLAQRQANFQKKTVILQWVLFFNWICLCLQRRWNFTRWCLLCHILCHLCAMRARSKLQVQGTSSAQPHPTPPHDLRSIDHVCKCKESHHPQPAPHPMRGALRERARRHARFSTRWQKYAAKWWLNKYSEISHGISIPVQNNHPKKNSANPRVLHFLSGWHRGGAPPSEEWHWRSTTRRDSQCVFLLTQSLVK